MTESRAIEIIRGAASLRAYEALAVLRDGESTVKALGAAVKVSQTHASVLMRVLRGYGLVECRPYGRERFYSVTPAAILILDAVDRLRAMP